MTTLLLLIIAGLVWYIWKQSNAPKPSPNLVVTITTTTSREADSQADKDAWDVPDLDLYGPGQRMRQLSGVRLNIHFTDRDGKTSQRDITSQRYAYNPDTKAGVLYAFCHMRNGNRPFALNRISKAVDLETGEIIPDLGSFLEKTFEQTPTFAVERFLAQHDAWAFVLFSFAKADGFLRAKERAILLGWAKEQGLTEPTALVELEAMLGNWYMTKGAFWDAEKSVKTIERTEDYMRKLWLAAVAIVQSDNKTHEQEAQFLRYAAEKWGIPKADVPALDTSAN